MRSFMFKLLIIGTALSLAACGEVVVEEGNNNPDPTLMAVSPTAGPLGGGTSATVTGGEFTDAAVVVVGPFVAQDIKVTDAGTVTFVTPAGLVSGVPQDVLVYNENGFTKLPGAFTYNAVPEISAIDVNHGNIGGGTQITIGGSGFMNNNGNVAVTIGGVNATNVTVVDDQTVTVKAPMMPPAMAFQAFDIVLTSDNGDATFEQAFTYTRPGLLVAKKGRNGQQDRQLYYVDPATGISTETGVVDVTPSRMAASADGSIYEVANNRVLSGFLVKMDPFSGQATPIGPIRDINGSTSRTRSLAMINGTLYGWGFNNFLYSIDPATGIYTTVGATNTAVGGVGCMERRDSNTVYFMRRFDQTLDTVNLFTGVVTTGVALGGNSNQACHGMALFNGTYYIVDLDRTNGDTTILEKIDINTGGRTPIATLPSHVTGLTVTPPGY